MSQVPRHYYSKVVNIFDTLLHFLIPHASKNTTSFPLTFQLKAATSRDQWREPHLRQKCRLDNHTHWQEGAGLFGCCHGASYLILEVGISELQIRSKFLPEI